MCMKKTAVLLVALLCTGVFAQQFNALSKIAVYVTGDLSESEKRALGTEMLNALVRSGQFTAVERSAAFVAEIEREQVTQRTGAIDDNQISRLGKRFGVRYVCIADVAAAFGSHQVSARILDVETAEIGLIGRASGHLNSMQALETLSGSVINSMGIGASGSTQQPAQQIPHAPMQASETAVTHNNYHTAQQSQQNFTTGQRWSTFGLNWLVPGVGSFAIMKDNVGGWIQVGGAVLGYIFLLNGFEEVQECDFGFYGPYCETRTEFNGAYWVGAGLLMGNFVYNIVRSSTYTKPVAKTAYINDQPLGLNFAVLPDRDGNLKAYARYSMEF